jgi:transposase
VDLAYQTPAEEIATLRCELATARAQLGTAAVEIEHLRMQLAALRRQQYGQSSERLDAEIVQLELRLEDLEESEAERQAAIPDPAPSQSPASSPTQSRAKAIRKPLPDHLPRETVVHEPERVCDCCDRSKLACLGESLPSGLTRGTRPRCWRRSRPG